jgi:hypothetical protein
MEFRIQDILKNIIPGILSLTLLLIFFYIAESITIPVKVPDVFKDFSEIVLIFFLGVTYFIGFVIDTIASILEQLLYKIIARPSFKLLNGKSQRYPIVQLDKLVALLKSETSVTISTLTNVNTSILFNVANLRKEKCELELVKEKVAEYYSSYIFSRNICCVFFLYSILLLISIISISQSYIIILLTCMQLVLLGLTLFRYRQKAYYYSRQVFNAALLVV